MVHQTKTQIGLSNWYLYLYYQLLLQLLSMEVIILLYILPQHCCDGTQPSYRISFMLFFYPSGYVNWLFIMVLCCLLQFQFGLSKWLGLFYFYGYFCMILRCCIYGLYGFFYYPLYVSSDKVTTSFIKLVYE